MILAYINLVNERWFEFKRNYFVDQIQQYLDPATEFNLK